MDPGPAGRRWRRRGVPDAGVRDGAVRGEEPGDVAVAVLPDEAGGPVGRREERGLGARHFRS